MRRRPAYVNGAQVQLRFFLNPFACRAEEEEIGSLTFSECSMWRLGRTNDEGWYAGLVTSFSIFEMRLSSASGIASMKPIAIIRLGTAVF